jgi:hypothetical protein
VRGEEGTKILGGFSPSLGVMTVRIREQLGAAIVAATIVGASFADGLFEPTGYAAAAVVVWAAVIAGLVSRALPLARIGAPAVAAGLCLAGTAALAMASLAWAGDQGRAFEEAVRDSSPWLPALPAGRAGASG